MIDYAIDYLVLDVQEEDSSAMFVVLSNLRYNLRVIVSTSFDVHPENEWKSRFETIR